MGCRRDPGAAGVGAAGAGAAGTGAAGAGAAGAGTAGAPGDAETQRRRDAETPRIRYSKRAKPTESDKE